MVTETMTAMERMEAAVRLRPVDRIPCAPLMDVFFPARYKGWTAARGLHSMREGFQAIVEVFEELGGWDGMILPGYSLPLTPNVYSGVSVGKTINPGRELDEDTVPQFMEAEVLTHEDYAHIVKLGWNRWRESVKDRFNPFPPDRIIGWANNQMAHYRYELQTWKSRGVRSLCGAITMSPLMILSTSRTLLGITKDIYRIPDQVEEVMEAMLDDLIADAIQACRLSGEPGVMLVMERGGCFYYPLRIYERFEFPHMKRMVEAFAAAGLITVMHLDQDYTENLPYFKELPRGWVVAELDSMTDIFKAKEVLKDHMCIAGDVPAALTSLGRPEEVEDYCKKLIDVVGDGGGFILSTGCTLPVDCKIENLRAMVETTRNYNPHRSGPC
jgi:uroporphyrinogen-III decarboxylase